MSGSDTESEQRRHAQQLYQQEALDVLRQLRERRSGFADAPRGSSLTQDSEWALQRLHSLKGSAQLLDFLELSAAIHHLEDEFLTRWANASDWARAIAELEHCLLSALGQSPRPVSDVTVAKPAAFDSPKTAGTDADVDDTSLHELLTGVGAGITEIDSIVTHLGEQSGEPIAIAAVRRLASLRQRLGRLNDRAVDSLLSARCVSLQEFAPAVERVLTAAAETCGKRIEMRIEGAGTPIDRCHFVMLRTAFEHLARNAAVHGIELPAERQRIGKPRCGHVTLGSVRNGASLVLSLEDDGCGIASEIAPDQFPPKETPRLRSLSRQSIDRLTSAGYTTYEPPDHLAGRGFGLGVVRQLVEALGGHFEIDSATGLGTVIRIAVPIVAGTPREVFVLAIEGRLYAIPLDIIVKAQRGQAPESATLNGCFEVLLACSGQQRRLYADELIGIRQVVFATLGPQLECLERFAGGGVLADGRQVLLLNPAWLLQYSQGSL